MHIWRLERDGKFPKRVKLSEAGAVAFVEAEIEQWIKSRIRGFGAPVWPRKPKSRERFSAEDLADLDTTTRRPRERL